MVRKIFKILAFTLLGILLVFAFLEIAYRNYWFDFYRPELSFLNPETDLDEAPGQRKTVLVLGDSFTASPDNYVDQLRNCLPEYRFINSAVPGTGLAQAGVQLEDRIEEFQPEVVVYQIYAANDLMDWEYPTQGEGLSFGRKLYWSLANRFRSLAWLNYKFGQRLRGGTESTLKDSDTLFDPARYNSREKLYFQITPKLIDYANKINIYGWRSKHASYARYFKEVFGKVLDRGIPVVVLFVPHCARVSYRYQERMEAIGAEFEKPRHLLSPENPFTLFLVDMYMRARGMRVVNPTETFQSLEYRGERMYFTHDPHLNARGQEVLADLLEEELTRIMHAGGSSGELP